MVRPLGQALSPGYYIDKVVGTAPPLDVNNFGQVLDSPWFFNRLARYSLSAEEVARGPNQLEGPAEGPLTVTGGKLQGATPGLVVKDSKGTTWVVKFDPPAYPELASSAEAIATKILFAAGYHVPENHVVQLKLDRLTLAKGASTGGRFGAKVPLTQKRLDALVTHINPFPDGTVRALFSRFLAGDVLGPFTFAGVREDDPNDRVPHERRRSLRGLKVFSAWLNNVDTRASNTLDVFVPSPEQPQRGHVQHYVIDFGDSLGSAGTKPKYIGEGYEGLLDWPMLLGRFFSLGIYYSYWLPIQRSPYRSVGIFEAQVFDFSKWTPLLPNPAFDQANIHDVYWAASIMARFTPDQLKAVVDAVGYSEPGAAEWVLRVLQERQYKILQYAFDRLLPLEDPQLSGDQLRMTDLGVRSGLQAGDRIQYLWLAKHEGQTVASGRSFSPQADLSRVAALSDASPFVTVEFWRAVGRDFSGPHTDVHLRKTKKGWLPVGMTRHAR